MKVVTRFAPSPTGYLHIGGARTALFNWLFAKHHSGKFLLRIEDTDRERSTESATKAIFEGMKWLGLDWDGEVVFQFARKDRHAEVARQMVKDGKAYNCYCSTEELAEMRASAEKEGKPFRYDGRWRDKTEADAPKGVAPAIRLKSPKEGSTIIDDQIQGRIEIPNSEIDDMVILRSDGTPTYMLAVVVDDHDMEITHVIRGVDHLTNAARQAAIYKAMGWELPIFAHVPLIHGPDGAKLSKRHGALGVDAYEEMGYLPEAMCNYLARLGWSHGDDEIFSREQATEWFSLASIGKSPARFDFDKLANLNGHYIRDCDNTRLVNLITPQLGKNLGEIEKNRILAGMNGLKERAKTLPELAKSAAFYIARPPLDEKAKALLNPAALELIKELIPLLSEHAVWDQASLEARIKQFAESKTIKLGQVAQPLRAAITGSSSSPGMFEVMAILGKDETIARLSSIS